MLSVGSVALRIDYWFISLDYALGRGRLTAGTASVGSFDGLGLRGLLVLIRGYFGLFFRFNLKTCNYVV